MQLADAEAGAHTIARLNLQQVLYGASLVGLVALGNIIDFQPVAASAVREEQHGVVHRCRIDLVDEVIVARSTGLHPYSTAALCLELCQRGTLDVAHIAYRHNHFVVGIEVFCVKLLCAGEDLRAAIITVLLLYLYQLVLDNLLAELVVSKDLIEVLDFLQQVIVLVVQVLLT